MGIHLDTSTPITKKINRKKNTWIVIIVSMFLCVGCFFAYKGIAEYMNIHNMKLTWDAIFHIADNTDDMPDMELTGDDGEAYTVSVSATNENPLFRFINFEDLKAINEDVSGWIYIPDTLVDYPILKETAVGEYFYQTHNIYKEHDVYGSIFELSDEQRGENSPVRWFFGHHMSSGDMFSPILEFEDQAKVDTPIYVYDENSRTEYHIAAVCVVDKTDMIYDFGKFDRNDKESYQALIDHINLNNKIVSQYSLSTDRDILVLSTCKGRSGTSTRIAVICIPYYTYTRTN